MNKLILLTLIVFSVLPFSAQVKNNKEKNAGVTPTAEQIAESVILIHAFPGGRETLNQIRKTTFERGKYTTFSADGRVEKVNFERYIVRGENLEKEKVRFEQDLPSGRFGLVYDGEKYFGIFNETAFPPRDDIIRTFQNQIWRGIEGLLRYKENGSKLSLEGKEKIMGVEFYRIDVIDKESRKTRYFVSVKSFRVMMLEYMEMNMKYVRKFYDYNYAQGTLVPYRTTLWEADRQIEETETSTISFGVKIEDYIFNAR